MAFGLEELADKVRKAPSLITAKTADKLKPLFEQEVKRAVGNFYDAYQPKMYNRTDNFRNNAYTDSDWNFSGGDDATISIDMYGGAMSDYLQIWGNGIFDGRIVFNQAYVSGHHGGGYLLMATTAPPHEAVSAYVNSGFNGQVNAKLIESADEVIGSLL